MTGESGEHSNQANTDCLASLVPTDESERPKVLEEEEMRPHDEPQVLFGKPGKQLA